MSTKKKTFKERLDKLPTAPFAKNGPFTIILNLLNDLKERANNPNNVNLEPRYLGSDLVVKIKYCNLEMISFNMDLTGNSYPVSIEGNNIFDHELCKSKKKLEDGIIKHIESNSFAQKMALAKIFDN